MASVTELDARTITDAVQIFTLGARLSPHNGAGKNPRAGSATAPREYSTNRVVVSMRERELYSYGRHFPLFRFVPRNGRHAPLFLINGDVWRGNNSRTNAHQSATRDAIAESGVASLIVPFSALDGAGIERDSVRPIHVRPDAQWEETRAAETLLGVPKHARTVSYSVDREAPTLDAIPERYRRAWRAYTDAERETVASKPGAYVPRAGEYAHLPTLPDADGIYRWSEGRTRPLAPDADGLYRWTVHVHRMGDSLFSGVREIREPMRAARPFECERETARETVSLTDADGRSYCDARLDGSADSLRTDETRARYTAHAAGPSGACVHCGNELRASVVWRRRARYLSSFDTNESPSLYFLAEVPRGAGETVETALDALAPRAVHAALARERDVARQGDIFFIDTALTDADLERRGIRSRARLTQWTRSARARAGETAYHAPLTRAERARMDRWTAHEWRRLFGAAVARSDARETSPVITYAERCEARELRRARWNELRSRHECELQRAAYAGADPTTPLSADCPTCDAQPGAACGPVSSGSESLDRRLDAEIFHGRPHRLRVSLAERHASERNALQRDAARPNSYRPIGAPHTDAGARARWAERRADYARELQLAETALTRAIYGHGAERLYRGYSWHAQGVARQRAAIAENVRRARERVDTIRARGAVDSMGNSSRAHARDSYRKGYGANALAAWQNARHAARLRFDPSYDTGARWDADRRAVRTALAVYGTAHTAREVVTLRSGAVYVRGTVSHRPDLVEGDRRERGDHAPILLGDGARWYLAVRNAVPRQSVRRRNRRIGRASVTRTVER